jgi:hypothetical protein
MRTILNLRLGRDGPLARLPFAVCPPEAATKAHLTHSPRRQPALTQFSGLANPIQLSKNRLPAVAFGEGGPRRDTIALARNLAQPTLLSSNIYTMRYIFPKRDDLPRDWRRVTLSPGERAG